MAAITSSSSSLIFTSTANLRSRNSLLPPSRLSLVSASSISHSLSSSFTSISPASFLPYPTISGSRRSSLSSFTVKASGAADKKKVLILNANSGGHAVIGFYFAKELLASGHEVTIWTVGLDEDEIKSPPFTRFSEIVSAGGKTLWGKKSKVLKGLEFDVLLDNHAKDLETVRPVVDWVKSLGTEQFLYISSAGIYVPTNEPPHVEGDAVKADASHVEVEKYISEVLTSWAVFRPQYMIGSGNNKDCEEWFFDRIVRGRPVLIPGSGLQLTNISHVRDLSSMLIKAVENPTAASGNIFNCVSDRAVTFDGMVKLCAQAAGLPVEIVHYDPKILGSDAKLAFPFRDMHFYAEPRAAKDILGWQPSTNLPEDLKERFEEYMKIGRDKQRMKFVIDDKILLLLKMPVPV